LPISCRNRHCPKCQALARAEWLEARKADLLPVPYFHVVFTVPEPVAAIALQNQRVVYDILFRTAAATLKTIAADPRHLGAEIGFIAVLHTWGQTLQYHPHLHCVVPGGGLTPDGEGWIACRPGFFLPVRVLSSLFRRLFLEALDAAFRAGELSFHASLGELAEPARFAQLLDAARGVKWVVYAKPPFGGPEQVLAYLGRYTHRVAIANSRLVAITDDAVSFLWKDYRQDGRRKVMTLEPAEFMRRFLLHVLPPASTASATSASSPMAIAQPDSRFVDSCWPNPPWVGRASATSSLTAIAAPITRTPTSAPAAAAAH
jgi:putative transposase/transposase-like zinc-binding protein